LPSSILFYQGGKYGREVCEITVLLFQAKFYFEVLKKNYPQKDITFVSKTHYGKYL